jgi:hypothetical protein
MGFQDAANLDDGDLWPVSYTFQKWSQAGAQVTGGGADSRPMEALALVAELLGQNKLVIKVQTFPFDRAADAYRISQGGHVRGKLVLIP